MTSESKAKLKVELINVGHGDALLLQWTSAEGSTSTILIDGGPLVGGQRIKETLDRIGAATINLAVLSHCDADHVDGLLAYAGSDGRAAIDRYWGPCLPAFRRHSWLFPTRIKRGLDKVEALQKALGAHCAISWPVEGATWTSPDGGLSIKALSPAGRLIERLLLGDDSLGLFLEQPTPLGWLLDETRERPPTEDPFADLRFAISTGEITPERVPENLPPTLRTTVDSEFAEQAAARGVDPEFFGNSVLNDTSLVLLVEARLGAVRRRLLFTGDLENFTYLMARQPMGLGCEIVKAPHHGSFSFVDRDKAYDAVWQWLRPRVVLVSANGKHGLPRNDFRDAALRYGATLFCTSRRSREIVSGPITEACCNVQYACHKAEQAPVSLSITEAGIDANGIACARGSPSGAIPIIEVRQHVVEPSPILTTLAENEIRRHTEWMVKWLRTTLDDRRQRPRRPDLEPISLNVLRKAAVAANRLAAASEMEVILERAAREGKVWLSRNDRFRSNERFTWIMPSAHDLATIESWIDQYFVIQMAVKRASAASAVEELLYAADTSWLADRFAEDLLFPRAMFDDIIWPIMVSYLLRTRSFAMRTLPAKIHNKYDAATIIVLFQESSITKAGTALRKKIERIATNDAIWNCLKELIEAQKEYYKMPTLSWPECLERLVSPLWLGRVLPPSGLMVEYLRDANLLAGILDDLERADVDKWISSVIHFGMNRKLPAKLASATLSVMLLGGFDTAD